MRFCVPRCLTVSLVNILLIAGLLVSAAIAAPPAAEEDAIVAQSLAQMLQAARTVISNHQDLINNPDLGDKQLTGQVVLDQAIKGYEAATGSDPASIDP